MMAGTVLTRGMALLGDALFPRFCVGCKREGKILCDVCNEVWISDGHSVSAEEVWSFGAYADPILRGLLTTWKYHFDDTAWAVLRRRLQPQMSLLHLRAAMAGVEAVVPVPLSRRRRAERGFDQAVEIAEWIAAGIHRPVLHLFERKHVDGHQAERTIDERITAMHDNPFSVKASKIADRQKVKPTHVLLVDDVWTTGATMHAAAEVLVTQGIASHFVTVAKG